MISSEWEYREKNTLNFHSVVGYTYKSLLGPESSDVKIFWIPAFAGMTFLEAALVIRLD